MRSTSTTIGSRKVIYLKLFSLNLLNRMMTVKVATADVAFISVPLKY
jgi:hypothetical protein